MPKRITLPSEIKPGDFYEDCAFHPCLCTEVGYPGEFQGPDTISGISLIDGTHPRSCSLKHCAVRLLSFEEALQGKFKGPNFLQSLPSL
jgi:hypothetical protein